MRLEIIADMALAVVDHSIEIGDLKARLGDFVRSYNRDNPGKYGPVSLDSPAFREGATPLIETISEERGLWA